ncbi:MAG: putative membrane protein YfcA [Candidatus Nanohaloarchaea archaeon]|jgi:uncharacterized membrane protein YfcA
METIFLISFILLSAGLVKGLVGFGEAVIGVGLISLILSPREAVVLMIIPIMVSNISLVREIGLDTVKSLLDDHLVLISSVFGGTILGMFFLGKIPQNILSAVIGLILIIYSVLKFEGVALRPEYFQRIPDKFESGLTGLLGSVGGFIFGATSMGALIVMYLEYLDLPREKFVGFLGFVFLLISGFRVGSSYLLGYYSGSNILYLSLLASVPVFIGVQLGEFIGRKESNKAHKRLVLLLFLLIGLRLIAR